MSDPFAQQNLPDVSTQTLNEPVLGSLVDREQKQQERWAKERIYQIRIFFAGLFVLFLATLYFAALNAYVISKAAPQPYHMEVVHSLSPDEEAQYAMTVIWHHSPSDTLSVYPQIVMPDGTVVPLNGEAAGVPISYNMKTDLNVLLPDGIIAGFYQGDLLFTKVSGPIELLETQSIPVRVDVARWSSWFVLGCWLGFLTFALLVFYLYFLWENPRPHGFLSVQDLETGTTRLLPLRMRKIGWLMPWKRSSLPLSYIWEQTRTHGRMVAQGEIVFRFRGDKQSPYLVLYRKNGSKFLKSSAEPYTPVELNYEHLYACNFSDRMFPGNLYVYCPREDHMQTILGYDWKKGLSHF